MEKKTTLILTKGKLEYLYEHQINKNLGKCQSKD